VDTRATDQGESVENSSFFAQMALDLQNEPTTERTIDKIAEYAQRATGCDDAGIVLVHARQQIETAAATSARVDESNHLQLVHAEGPSLDVMGGEPFYICGALDADSRWPNWGPAAATLGYYSVLSMRLETKTRRYGALNLYSASRNAFSDDELAVASIFVQHASVALANAHNEEGLQAAIDARKLIGQAQGILMERYSLDANRAFEFLRRQSQTHNVKLRDVAAWIVDNRATPDAVFTLGSQASAAGS
jgi:GAF domain-containing protein